MAYSTAETIIGLARSLLREESGSDVPVIADEFMLAALSEANMRWFEAFKQDGNAPVVFQREFGVDLVDATLLSANITTASVSVGVDSSASFPSASAVVIWDDTMPDVITYTANAANTFTGVTGIGFNHEDGDLVELLYALPSYFGDFRSSVIYGDGVLLNGVPLYFMSGPPVAGYFSMYDDGTTKYLWLPRGSTGSASILYDKDSTTIDSIDDTVDVPFLYQFFLVWHLVSYAYIGRENNASSMLVAEQKSDKILQRALGRRNTGKKIHTRSFQRFSRDYTTINGQVVNL